MGEGEGNVVSLRFARLQYRFGKAVHVDCVRHKLRFQRNSSAIRRVGNGTLFLSAGTRVHLHCRHVCVDVHGNAALVTRHGCRMVAV